MADRVGTDDRKRLTAFFHTIDDGAFIALPPDAGRVTQSDQQEDLTEIALQRGLVPGQWSGVGWHAQSAERAFDRSVLIRPLAVHWVGDHATVAAALAGLGAPYTVRDGGADAAFFIDPPPADDDGQLPEVTDTAAVRKVLGFLYEERDELTEPETHLWPKLEADDETGHWLVEVIGGAAPKAAAEAVSLFELSEPAVLDAVVPRWAELAKATDDLWLVQQLLEALRAVGDPRHATVLAEATTSRDFRAQLGAAAEWAAIGGADAQQHLDRLARRKKPVLDAVEGWIDVTAHLEGRPMREVAVEAMLDTDRNEDARRAAYEHLCYSLHPEIGPLRLLLGGLDIIEDDTSAEAVRRFAFGQAVTSSDWRSEEDPRIAGLRARLLPWLDVYGADVHPVTLQWHRDRAAPA